MRGVWLLCLGHAEQSFISLLFIKVVALMIFESFSLAHWCEHVHTQAHIANRVSFFIVVRISAVATVDR